ncbi:hypothetical protein DPMN_136729 [Dreissena polymorpha]|uniref:Uncharacterized protein n=1 Tax=Dreissena polymorpha TaxID=45954 RepID=A0A9D4G3W0_DREPO|nr:hypothetical protein DPMN_136729 [Dreissena polymorpha]
MTCTHITRDFHDIAVYITMTRRAIFPTGSASSLSGSLVPDLFGAAQIADFSGINMFFSAVAAFTGLPAAGE